MKRRDDILDRWAAGESSPAIARTLGMDEAGVRSAVCRARAAGDARARRRHKPYEFHGKTARTPQERRLGEEAGKRGVSVRQLRSLIVRAVVDDNLFSAVLE